MLSIPTPRAIEDDDKLVLCLLFQLVYSRLVLLLLDQMVTSFYISRIEESTIVFWSKLKVGTKTAQDKLCIIQGCVYATILRTPTCLFLLKLYFTAFTSESSKFLVTYEDVVSRRQNFKLARRSCCYCVGSVNVEFCCRVDRDGLGICSSN